MINQRSLGLCALLLAAAALPAAADNAVIDVSFGQNGFARVDSAQGDTTQDRAVGICPGPAGSQVLVGVRAEPGMLTLARLLPDGSLDASYGVQGRVEYAIAGASSARPRNLCLGDGRLELAYTTPLGKIELLRIAASGQPEAAFGSGGRVSVGPAALPGSNSGFMSLRGADRATGGEILLSGELGGSGMGGDGRAALIRVSANGMLRDSRVFSGGAHRDGGYAAAAGYAPNGDLWVAGASRQNAGGSAGGCVTWFRQTLNGVTLAGDAVELGPFGPWSYAVNGGRRVRPGVLVLGMHLHANAGGLRVPRLQIQRATGSHEVALPLSQGQRELTGDALNLVAMNGGERVMYASSLSRGDDIYLARVTMPGQPPGCDGGGVPPQWFSRLGLWDGQPVFVGNGAVDCQIASAQDLLVGRISRATDRIFHGDFGPWAQLKRCAGANVAGCGAKPAPATAAASAAA